MNASNSAGLDLSVSDYMLGGFQFPRHEIKPNEWFLTVLKVLEQVRPRLQYFSGFSNFCSFFPLPGIIYGERSFSDISHCVELWKGNSDKEIEGHHALSARLFLVREGRLFLCHSAEIGDQQRHVIDWLGESELLEFIKVNNLVYPAGYTILEGLLKLGKFTLMKIDERRKGIQDTVDELEAIMGRIS